MLTWFASVVNWFLEGGFNSETAGAGLAAFSILPAAVLIAGRVRLNLIPTGQRSVRVATVG